MRFYLMIVWRATIDNIREDEQKNVICLIFKTNIFYNIFISAVVLIIIIFQDGAAGQQG